MPLSLFDPQFSFFWLLVYVLATYRITSIVWRESIFEWFRKLLGVKHDDEIAYDPNFWEYPDNLIGELFSCFWCLSVWVGILTTVVWFVWSPALIPFALSAGAILIRLKER